MGPGGMIQGLVGGMWLTLNEGEYFIKNIADDPSEQRAVKFENRIR